MIPPKRFDIFPPDWGMLRRSICVQIFLLTTHSTPFSSQLLYVYCNNNKNSVHRLGQPKSRNDFYNLRITENIDVFDRNRIYSDQRDKPVMPICRLMTNFLISHAVFPSYCLKFGVSRGETYQDVGTFLTAPEALDRRRGKRQQRQLLGLLGI